jgi:hypothetical protein
LAAACHSTPPPEPLPAVPEPAPADAGTEAAAPSSTASARPREVAPEGCGDLRTYRAGCAPAKPTAYNACSSDADCEWGEIDHEILTRADCTCLFGCGFLALNKSTVVRRGMQHKRLCLPHKDGSGNLCPVDDCAAPPRVACRNGVCAVGR